MAVHGTFDLGNEATRAKLHAAIDGEKGIVTVDVVRFVRCRTNRQNAYYHPCFVHPFGEWLRDHGNTHFTDDMAHEVLKRMFLEVTEILSGGKRLTYVRSTTTLTTIEFNEYLDKVAAFLATECGFTVADPIEYYESDYSSPPPRNERAAA